MKLFTVAAAAGWLDLDRGTDLSLAARDSDRCGGICRGGGRAGAARANGGGAAGGGD